MRRIPILHKSSAYAITSLIFFLRLADKIGVAPAKLRFHVCNGFFIEVINHFKNTNISASPKRYTYPIIWRMLFATSMVW